MNAFLEKISGLKTIGGALLLVGVAFGRHYLPDQSQVWDYLYAFSCGIVGAGLWGKAEKFAQGDKVFVPTVFQKKSGNGQ